MTLRPLLRLCVTSEAARLVDVTTDETQPGQRAPAPGRLRLVQAFLNTHDIEAGADELGAPDRLAHWLAGHGLLSPDDPVTAGDLARAVEVREALRALALSNNGEPLDAGASRALERAAAAARLALRFDAGRASLQPEAPGVDGALGRLLAIVLEAMAEGTWPRLKACREDVCQWAFYDRSRNRSGTWCTMEICGNRAKARRYRRRRRVRDPAGTAG